MKFKNEAFTDFAVPENAARLARALQDARRDFGQGYPAVINGRRHHTRKSIRSLNPSLSKEVVGTATDSNLSLADQALESATRAFQRWRGVPVEERAALLRRMAARLRTQKAELTAWIIYEVGKNWAEADADVAEAIDFLEYYAELAVRPPPALTPVAHEHNRYRYLPLGPVVVIPPWNFPLAILAGMSAAALVTGNTVVLKPSSQSPVIGARFFEAARACGVPEGVMNFLPGSGSAIGDYLVKDRRTRMVAFTGSLSVGLRINALAAKPQKGQRWIKRVIAELGGKNAIVVDESADIERAAAEVAASAFGYQGQKCSACSRVFVHKRIYEAFEDRILAQIRALRIGPSAVRENTMGPVISKAAQLGIQRHIALGEKHGRLLHGGRAILDRDGFYLEPTLIGRLPNSSPLWVEEIFGPVLAIAPVGSLEEGIRRANETAYGLTGAVYTRDPKRLQLAAETFFCGNLYLNRKCTGALVGGHPFGGFNLSGTDSKAGGPEYLLQFSQPQAISGRRE